MTYRYDTYGPVKLVVRGVRLLDYSPGGPDFQPALFDPANLGCGYDTHADDSSGRDIGGGDEVHGEAGDDTIYTGCGDDVVFGDGQDDDVVLGWGDDWASGGSGQDAILGDDGRILTSRNAATGVTTAGVACSGPGTAAAPCWAEPLFGILALLATDPDPKVTHGNVLSENIYTPGHVQEATINKAGELAKAFDITPFDWRPNGAGADDPLFDANRADDVIFGGLGDDFLHGAVGDDAILGAEALTDGYAQRYAISSPGSPLIGAVRSDWSRPYNSGDMLAFGNDDDSWHDQQAEPRRVRALRRVRPAPRDLAERRRHEGHDRRQRPELVLELRLDRRLDVPRRRRPRRASPYPLTRNDGRDLIFGDQGNDWLVGGTGRDDLWGGWGTDLLHADDLLGSTDGGTADNAPDTSPNYEDRAYAGAGYDILIGNTGGDRLIDWVGEFNSYIVPFAPFGIDTVSRQRPPGLDEFLYALSRADGADPTRWTRHDLRPVVPAAQRRAVRRARPGHAEGPRPVAGADRRPDRSAARQHPRRQARRPELGRLQRRRLRHVPRRQRRVERHAGLARTSRRRRSAATRRRSSTSTTTCRSTTRSRRR